MGINKEIFVDKKEVSDYVCTICTDVAYPPSTTKCSHVFCTDCITKWFEENETCPNCQCQNPSIEENTFIQRIIASKNVECANEGCNFKSSCSEFLKHECPFEEIDCEFDGCNKKIQRREMEKHQLSCEFRLVQCTFCKQDDVVFTFMNVIHFINISNILLGSCKNM